AERQRLRASEIEELRALVLTIANSEVVLDADWLWALLRPVTDLVEQVGGARVLRYLGAGDDDDAVPFTPYLRLA
ncbi:MAG TPA: hypothetical protein VGJ60_31670, partial [Chloroflexota bacterium]